MLPEIEETAASPPLWHEAPTIVHAAELWLHSVRSDGEIQSMLMSDYVALIIHGFL